MAVEYAPPEIAGYAKAHEDKLREGLKVEGKEALPKSTDDPKEFLARFKQSEAYQDGLRKREEETLARNPQISRELIEEKFLESKEAKNSLHDFYRDQFKVTYNPEKYSPEFRVEINEYFRMSRSNDARQRLGRFASQDDLVEAELKRMRQHERASEQLATDGVLPNARLARVFIHFLAVSEGIDSYSPDRDEYRIKYRGY